MEKLIYIIPFIVLTAIYFGLKYGNNKNKDKYRDIIIDDLSAYGELKKVASVNSIQIGLSRFQGNIGSLKYSSNSEKFIIVPNKTSFLKLQFGNEVQGLNLGNRSELQLDERWKTISKMVLNNIEKMEVRLDSINKFKEIIGKM